MTIVRSTTLLLLLGMTSNIVMVRADSPAPTTTPVENVVTPEKKLELAQMTLMQARATAARDYQNRPEYQTALKNLHAAFGAFNDKRNALIADLAKTDKRIDDDKKKANDADNAINEACRPNSNATPEQVEELFRQKETFTRDWQTIENDAMDRAGLTPLRRTWTDASAALATLTDREADDIEKTDAVKAASAAVATALAEMHDTDPIEDYLRRYPRAQITPVKQQQ